MIFVLATVQLHAGKRQEFLEHFHRLVPFVHAEEGCIEYGPTIDVETTLKNQGPVRPDTVVIVEKWSSMEALEQHLIAPHMMDYRQKVRDLILQVNLQILTPA